MDDVWQNSMLGLRMGSNPQAIVTHCRAALNHRSGNPTTGFIFRGPRCGNPINPDNIAWCRIRPALNRCAVCGRPEGKPHVGHDYRHDPKLPSWHGWHAFRRGLATNLHAMGIDDMTIQKILRHTDVAVTQRCYIRTLPPAVEAAMARFDDAVGRFVQ